MKSLVDLDMICHEIGHLKIPVLHNGEDLYDEDGKPVKELLPYAEMVQIAKGRLWSIVVGCEAGGFSLYATVGRCFRHAMATIKPYKGHREGAERDSVDDIKDMFIKDYPVDVCTKWEADDAMAMEQHADLMEIVMEHQTWDEDVVRQHANTVIASRDKDLDTVWGWRFKWWLKNSKDAAGNPRHPDFIRVEKGEVYWVTMIEAIRNFYKQMILGDTSDNIHGLYGKGEKSAWYTQLDDMDNEQDMYDHVHRCYTKYYREHARTWLFETARLLHMKRTPKDEWWPPNERDEH